jgi:hypothetical protein
MLRRFFGNPVSILAGAAGLASAPLGAVNLAAVHDPTLPMHEPPLEPRDEAVFLLTAAAEIEHALMTQYLFAAYSLRVVSDEPHFEQLDEVQRLLLQIAREEMGHLATVQNLLHLIGGPLNFNREHSPYASDIYPFRFKLEPLTLDSLAKYVVAESPLELPADFPQEDRQLYDQIVVRAVRSNDGEPVNHVGPVFARLERLFKDSARGLRDEDFRLDTTARQARFEDWGYEPREAQTGERLIIESPGGADVAQAREAATKAIRDIGQQGEGFDLPPAGSGQSESHFERFFDIFKLVAALPADARVTWPVTENPNTTTAPPQPPSLMKMLETVVEAHRSKGRITHPRARAWANLFNLRYRLLLAYLSHFLRLSQDLYVRDNAASLGDRTARGLLLIWTFNEMRRLRKIAHKLVRLPRDEQPGEATAGPPFELPYTLNLPDREEDRWRAHLDVSRASVRLVRETLQAGDPTDAADGFLADLLSLDEQDQVIMQSLAGGDSVPEGSLPTDFQKVVLILEESVRGFDVVSFAHGNFWHGQTRDEFIEQPPPIGPEPHLIEHTPGGGFNPDGSPLVVRLESTNPRKRMPLSRPPVAAERLRFIRQWITEGCRDNDPAGQPGIMRERNPTPEPIGPVEPPPQTLSFEADIKNLFRAVPDVSVMKNISGFDLHRFEDVRENAERIFERIADGTMPCDGAWPPDRIAIFRKWIDDGMNP